MFAFEMPSTYSKHIGFTECSNGFYGYNCEETCSLTCGVPGECDRITGSCNGRCLVGWKGSMCEHGNYCVKTISVLCNTNMLLNKKYIKNQKPCSLKTD